MSDDLMIRWLIRRDMPEVLQIEQDSFADPWTDEDFLCCLRQRNCIGMVAEVLDKRPRIAGFMIYELHKSQLHLLNMAVAPRERRKGIGKAMMDRLADKLSMQRRNEILLEVRERNTGAQLFFRSQRFQAIRVLRGHYEDTDEDAYLMRYWLDATHDHNSPYSPRNRISEYESL